MKTKNEMSRWNCGSLLPERDRLANSSQVRQEPAAAEAGDEADQAEHDPEQQPPVRVDASR